MWPKGLNRQQYTEACQIADMPEGSDKERAKRAWSKLHSKRWPRVLFRGNPDAHDICEKSGGRGNVIQFPGKYLIAGLS